jgi:uncharacterized protein YbjT (DUF2867 family)
LSKSKYKYNFVPLNNKEIMKYVITGSLGHISKPLATRLVQAGHAVTIISSKEDKSNEIKALGAVPAIGSVEDVSFLTKTFKGADAVYTMIPPTFAAADWKAYIHTIGKKYAEAIRNSGIKYVVNLSSVGAHMPKGCGPVSGLHFAEKEFDALADVNVRHLRPGFFFYNFMANIGMIKHAGFIGGNYGQGGKMVLSHTNDIAEAAAEELLNLSFKGKSVRYLASDEVTTDIIAKELGSAINKPDLQWVDFTDEQSVGGMIQAGLPEEIAKNYTEMGSAVRSGEMFSDFYKNKPATYGKTKLKDFAKEFAHAFNA